MPKKTLVNDWLPYVQIILQPSIVGPFDMVDPRHLPNKWLQRLCHNPTLLSALLWYQNGTQ